MGLWARIKRIFRSIFMRRVRQLEDPAALLPTRVEDMGDELVTARQQVAASVADEKLLKRKLDRELASVKEWDQKAVLAVRAGRDDLAEAALDRKAKCEKFAAQLASQHGQMLAATDSLRRQLQAMHGKIEGAKHSAALLIARQNAAEAQKRVQATMGGFAADNSAFAAFDRMAEKVDKMEAEADAAADINNEFTGQDLEDQFATMEAEVEAFDALAALKSRMGITHEEDDDEIGAEAEAYDFEALERELATVEVEAGH